MKKTTAAFAAVLLLLAACGDDPTVPAGGAAPSPSSAEGSPSPDTSPEPSPTPQATTELQVWFAYEDGLFPTTRSVPDTEGVARAALTALLQRPSEFEANAGLTTAVPAGTQLLGVALDGGVLTVDLSSEFNSTQGSAGEMMALAQVVYTATQFPTVEGVSFRVEGEAVEMSAGHGIDLSEPQKRKDFADLLPLITVESPAMGERVTSPVTVSGTANVYEATVSMRLLDAQGKVLDKTFATATCGTGCRGDYSEQMTFTVDHEQHGVVEVWWDSAEDGSRQDVIAVPVTLAP